MPLPFSTLPPLCRNRVRSTRGPRSASAPALLLPFPGALVCAVFLALLGPGEALAGGGAAFSDQTAAAGISASFSDVPQRFLGGGAVGDFDGDGWQDLFYPAGGNGADKLYINNRDGTFTDRASEWGIAVEHRSTAAAVGDFDGDGRLDLFVTSLGPNSGMAAGHHRLY